MRALLVALDAWASDGVEPPESSVPRIGNGTLVGSAQEDVGFPRIPGVEYNGRMHEGDLMDFGPQAGEGILTFLPPHREGSPYPALVPKTDADGDTLAGVRLPDIAAPVATYTGWSLRRNPPRKVATQAGWSFLLRARRRTARQPPTPGCRLKSVIPTVRLTFAP